MHEKNHAELSTLGISEIDATDNFPNDLYVSFLFDYYGEHGPDFGPDTCVIPLSRGYFAIISKDDYERVKKNKWYADVRFSSGEIVRIYACRKVRIAGKDTKIYLHRFIAEAGGGVIVDHKNNCTLDNRREKLRVTNHSENNFNSMRLPGKSGLKGVTCLPSGKWRAQIQANGKKYWKDFVDLSAAVSWRQKQETKLFQHASWISEKTGEALPQNCQSESSAQTGLKPGQSSSHEDVPF